MNLFPRSYMELYQKTDDKNIEPLEIGADEESVFLPKDDNFSIFDEEENEEDFSVFSKAKESNKVKKKIKNIKKQINKHKK